MFFKNNNTKEEIIQLLSKNWPLSLTEIHQKLMEKSSYQYTRQCVLELCEQNILVKQGKKYEISLVWLEKVLKFSKKTQENYIFGIKNNVLDKESSQIRINSLEELGNFMLEALERQFLEEKDARGFFAIVNHLWIPFINRDKLRRLQAAKQRIGVIYTKNTMLDKILDKGCYKKHVNRIKHVNKEFDHDIFVYNNCVFQIYFPIELRELMAKTYSAKFELFQKISDLFAMTFKEFPINIVITRNEDIANVKRRLFQDIWKR